MSTGKIGSNSEKGVTSPEMGKAAIQSCTHLGCSLLWRDIIDLEVLHESYAFGHAKKDLTFDSAEQAGTEEQQK